MDSSSEESRSAVESDVIVNRRCDQIKDNNQPRKREGNNADPHSIRGDTNDPDVELMIKDLQQLALSTKSKNGSAETQPQNIEQDFRQTESVNRDLVEHVSNRQEHHYQVELENREFQGQIIDLQRQLQHFEIHDENTQQNGSTLNRQLTEDGMYQMYGWRIEASIMIASSLQEVRLAKFHLLMSDLFEPVRFPEIFRTRSSQ